MAANKNDRIRGSNPFERPPSLAELTGALVRQDMAIQPVPDNAILQTNDGAFQYGRFIVSLVGLYAPEDISEREWFDFGDVVHRLQESLQWVLGDWLVLAERKWGTTYQLVAEQFGYEVSTLRNLATVARKVEISRRRDTLRFGHHQAVAAKPPVLQDKYLTYAEIHGLRVKELRDYIHQQENPPTLLGGHRLLHSEYKSAFDRLWSDLEQGRAVNAKDISQIERWLEAIKQEYIDRQHE